MRPITKSVPKAMLPVGRKPVLQWVVEEAVSAGLAEVGIVVRPGEKTIRRYFTADGREPGLDDLLAACRITWLEQAAPGGLGDALLQAAGWVGDEPFAMLIPDQLFHGERPAIGQVLDRWQPGPAVWSSMVRIPRAELPYFPGACGFVTEPGVAAPLTRIERLATEAETEAAFRGRPEEWRGFGRTLFSPEVFRYLGPGYRSPANGEVDLAQTFAAYTNEVPHFGVRLEGEAFDLGTWEGYYRYLPRLWELEACRR